jgi:uncharacterized protein (DUF1800 family)
MTIRPMTSRRTFAALVAAGLLSWSAGPVTAERENAVPAKPDDRTILHVLNRIGFGPRPGDLDRVRQMGLAAYIDQQLHPERLPDTDLNARLADFPTLSMSTRELANKYFVPAQEARRNQQLKQQKAEANAKSDPTAADATTPGDQASAAPAKPAVSPEVIMARQGQQEVITELTQAHLLREAMSERQLDEVLVDFWFNHFNVFLGKGQVRDYLPEYERDVIRPRVLGKFRDLLGAVAHSPAMLFYLDNWQSSTPNANADLPPGVMQRLNDPFLPPFQRQQLLARLQQMRNQQQRPKQTRGLNENYGRELMELHTLGVDGGYTQKDVVEVARAFTGWTIDRPQMGGSFVFRPQMHDAGEKIILGHKFPSGHGEDEGEHVLDILAKHPATAHHIAFELAQRFVADEPPATLVDRAATTFLDTNGDLREVTRAIITSPEFFAAGAYRSKVKSPLEFVISAVRASGATVVNAQPIAQALRAQLGMPLYGCVPPTGYSNTSDAWVNTGALLSRMNFAVQLVNGGQIRPGARQGGGPELVAPPRPAQLARAPVQVDVTALASDTSEPSRDRVVEAMLAGDVSDATKNVLAKAETPEQLVALTLGSPEFQRR